VLRRLVLALAAAVLVGGVRAQSPAAQEAPAVGPAGVWPASSAWRQHEIAQGWKIKAVAPRASLDASFWAEVEQADESRGWLPASTMPAMAADILLQNGKIEAPWLPGRAKEYQWIAEQDWVYAVHFPASDPQAESWLRFEGLDTIVDVYLNGKPAGSHWNMFVPCRVNVTGRLLAENTLVLHFHTVFAPGGQPMSNVGGDPEKRVRRPNQNYINYLGPDPSFSRVGVYGKVFLEVTHGSRLTKVAAGASLNESLTVGTVTVKAGVISARGEAAVQARVLDEQGKAVGTATANLASDEAGVYEGWAVATVDRPRLWWPRGYGEPALYKVETTLLIDGQPHQTVARTVGFRRVTMPQRLHFVVNGVPVRLWGGDWVTPRWDTAVWDEGRAEKLFALARNAHFNAFRVWGEVECPPEAFYAWADTQGFMLWQDFTCLPLQADAGSRAICREEATGLVERLQHHPSIFVWCGGNENAMWHDEEFNGKLEDQGAWPGLAAAEEVGAICGQLDPERYYQPSTPYYGDNPNDPREGNTHGYTNMWYVPGYDYLNFASEDTRIAAPPLHSLRRFMAGEDIWPSDYSPVYAAGQIHPFPRTWLRYTTSTSWKKTGPVELFYDATGAASLVHRLGMAEAWYYQDVVERQRRGRDATDPSGRRRCGGYIVWKYNDSWPQIYSAKVDYFLEPYHAYYALRRAYAPILLSFDVGTYIYLWAVNDTRDTVSGTVRIQLFHLDLNKVRKEVVRDATVPPGQSVVVVRLDEAGISTFRREHILYATLTDAAGRVLARADSLADIERRVTFPEARLDVKVRDGALVIKSDRFARSVTLEGDDNGDAFGWFFDDNYFDLMPGEEKVVRSLGDHGQGRVTAKAWYSPHFTSVEWRR